MRFLALLLATSTAFAAAPVRDWQYHARRLTGFSDTTRRESLHQLRQRKHLQSELRTALSGRQRYLALDVITTLGFHDFLQDLFPLTHQDESGAVILAINALLTQKTRPQILEHYTAVLERLNTVPLSAPAIMALLDVLGRLKHPISEEQLESFMDVSDPGIRSAAIYYARLMRKDPKLPEYRATLERGLEDAASQIRKQSELAAAERPLPPKPTGFWASLRRSLTKPTWRQRALAYAAPKDFIFPRLERKPETKKATQECNDTWAHFFRGETADIRIVFGYKDARPSRYVGDRYEAAWYSSYLTAKCVPGWHACGFTRDPSDISLYQKLLLGPDGKPRTVRVWLSHSSAGPDDDENRNDAFQKWRSEYVERLFLDGIELADAVFYSGHSRDGGGPDFAPPKLAPDNHVYYDWYAKHKPGMPPLMTALKHTNALQLLGMFSCGSTGHFLNEVRSARPALGLITSPKMIYYTDAMRNLLSGLSALLGQECETDFNASLRARAKVGDSHLNGFFRRRN